MAATQGNELIARSLFPRLRLDHEVILLAPVLPGQEETTRASMAELFDRVHLVPRSRRLPSLVGWLEPLAARAHLPLRGRIDAVAARRMSREIRRILATEEIDVVHVRQLPMAGYAGDLGATPCLIELIDAETLAAARDTATTARAAIRRRVAQAIERRAIRPYPIATVVAEADAAALRALGPGPRIEVVPNGVDADWFRPQTDVAVVPGSVVFVGAMSFPPNVAAMRWFVGEVLPRLRTLRPDVALTIVGRDPTPAVLALGDVPSVTVTGAVDDVRPWLARAAVVVAPMVSGSGIKNKLLEAMAMGRPVVATSLAAEGVAAVPDRDLVVADGPAALADAVAAVLDDTARAEAIAEAGRSLVETHYTWDACAARYAALYKELAASRPSPVADAPGRDRSAPISAARTTDAAPGAGFPETERPLRLAYLMSRFPKATETFILYEILELERLGHRVEIFPLVREREAVVQPGAAALVERAHDLRPWSRTVLLAQLHWLRRRPRTYLGSWIQAISSTARSPRFLLRALVAVPVGAAIGRQVVDLDLDHIHAHWATHPTLAAWVASRLSDRPYSFTAHAHDIYVERAMLDVKIRDAAFVVTISEANRRLIEGWYGAAAAARVAVIHCGTDPTVFHATDVAEAEASSAPASAATDPPATLEIVVVASLQPQKGQRVLVDACAILRDRGRSVRATLIGEGTERPALEQRVRELALDGVVTLAGALPRDRVANLVGAADVVVQPSVVLASGKTEGIPVALMEALAAERAVVASRVSGIPELVRDGETGLLVPPGDPTALADAIERLAGDPGLRAALGAAGRALVLAEFDLRINTAALADRFRGSAASRHGAAG